MAVFFVKSMIFALKIHLVINNFGELIAFKMTRGNVHDGAAAKSLLSSLEGLAFGDKGYIGKNVILVKTYLSFNHKGQGQFNRCFSCIFY